jgi:hypothetical protein
METTLRGRWRAFCEGFLDHKLRRSLSDAKANMGTKQLGISSKIVNC